MKKTDNVVFKPKFFKSKESIKTEQKNIDDEKTTRTKKQPAVNKPKQIKKKGKIKLNNFNSEDDDHSSDNDHNNNNNNNNKNNSVPIVQNNNIDENTVSNSKEDGQLFKNVVDIKQPSEVEKEIKKPKPSLFFSKKSKSMNSENKEKKNNLINEDSDSDEDKEFEKIISRKFKMTKSLSDTSSLITSSPGSLNSSLCNEKETPAEKKTFVHKRIFSSNQTKKVFHYSFKIIIKLT